MAHRLWLRLFRGNALATVSAAALLAPFKDAHDPRRPDEAGLFTLSQNYPERCGR